MKYINKREEPKSALEVPLEKSTKKPYYSLFYRIAVCIGANGYYLVQANTSKRADELQVSQQFVEWVSEWEHI